MTLSNNINNATYANNKNAEGGSAIDILHHQSIYLPAYYYFCALTAYFIPYIPTLPTLIIAWLHFIPQSKHNGTCQYHHHHHRHHRRPHDKQENETRCSPGKKVIKQKVNDKMENSKNAAMHAMQSFCPGPEEHQNQPDQVNKKYCKKPNLALS